MAVCNDCDESGVVHFAGILYCGRCALERLIRALRAEIADPEVEPEGSEHRVLVE